MIKGCQRTMIVIQGKDKSIFETAYFVVRRERAGDGTAESDMLAEASQIIRENSLPRGACRRGTRRLWGFLLILGGLLMGCGSTVLLMHWIA